MTEIASYNATGGSMPVITGGHLDAFIEWSKKVALGSVIPDSLRGKPADVFITVMHGLDLGLRPMQALNLVYVVKGRPSLSAEGMRALLLRDGHELQVVEATATRAVVRGRRKGTETWVEAEFTDAQRKRAKLGGANWDAYPEDMLVARATTRLCKRYFGDVIGGLPSTEEILDEPPLPRTTVTLAEAAQQRQQGAAADTVTGEIDDQAEAERLRREVEALAAEQQQPAVEDGVVVEDLPAGYDDGAAADTAWPEVAQPGSKAGAR